MRYFYDLEFIEDGRTIDLISVGIVAEDGREYYAVNRDIDSGDVYAKIRRHPWLMENVIPHLPTYQESYRLATPESLYGRFELDMRQPEVKSAATIAREVSGFLLATDKPIELWAYYGAYDYVCLMQLWGPMIAKPDGIPMFTHDIMQLAGGWDGLPKQEGGQHHALADAKHVKRMWDAFWAEPPF